MPLPAGFDPATGRFTGVASPRISSSFNPTNFPQASPGPSNTGSIGHGGNRSWWGRVNDCIKWFGNWVDSKIEVVSGWFIMISLIITLIASVLWIFSDSDLIYIILRIVGAFIVAIIVTIGTGIAAFVLSMALKIVRFIFWNIYTLIFTILFLLALYLH